MIIDDCSHLTYGSGKKINVQCEKCNSIRLDEYKHARACFERTGNNFCRRCCCSEETKKKLSELKKGVARPSETIEKMSIAMKGKFIGEKNPMFGRSHTEESKKKQSESKIGRFVGEDNPNWKPPEERITDLYSQIRNSVNYKIWRKTCFERDGYACQNEACKQYSGELHVDHIKPFALIIKENEIKTKEEAFTCQELWNIDNGRTLCVKCHKETDTYLNGTKKILKEVS